MESEDPAMTPEVAESQVARAMEAARKRAGLTVETMVRRLRPTLRMKDVSLDKKVSQNWYDWRDNPRSIPAVALVAAAHIAETSIDALLSPEQSGASRQREESQVAELRNELAQQRRHTSALETRLEQLVDQLAGGSGPMARTPAELIADPAALLDVVAELCGQMAEVGRTLGRPWADQIEAATVGNGDPAERIRRTIGLIEAQMMDLESSAGLSRRSQTAKQGLVETINQLTLRLAAVRGRLGTGSEPRSATM